MKIFGVSIKINQLGLDEGGSPIGVKPDLYNCRIKITLFRENGICCFTYWENFRSSNNKR